MTIKLIHKKPPIKAKEYTMHGGSTIITLGIHNPAFIKLWNERRFQKAFELMKNDDNKRRNI